jgi:chemotaxis protein MotB
MTEKEHQEIVVIRRRVNPEEGHHGGAWKIAFADFMTAMMALFLVLWLISSTSDKTKQSVAQYFNPVKLVDMTTLKKGFRDPKDTEMGSGSSIEESPSEPDANQTPAGAKATMSRTGARPPKHSEAALFRDPYGVLAEIVQNARNEASKRDPRAAPTHEAAPSDAAETFKDPFSTVPDAPEPQVQAAARPSTPNPPSKSASTQNPPKHSASTQDAAPMHDMAAMAPAAIDEKSMSAARGLPAVSDTAVQTQQSPASEIKLRDRSFGAAREAAADARQANAAEAVKLKSDIVDAAKPDARPHSAPHIEVQSTDEGILVSLTDDLKYMMFAIGSAEPEPKVIEVMANLARLLKTRPGSIVIRGHSDGRPYKSPIYDNWRLSAARAHMAHYMLARGGLDEKRIEKIEGYADRRLKFPDDPSAPGNRRIEILLRKEKP